MPNGNSYDTTALFSASTMTSRKRLSDHRIDHLLEGIFSNLDPTLHQIEPTEQIDGFFHRHVGYGFDHFASCIDRCGCEHGRQILEIHQDDIDRARLLEQFNSVSDMSASMIFS
jgi:hypothetical protein